MGIIGKYVIQEILELTGKSEYGKTIIVVTKAKDDVLADMYNVSFIYPNTPDDVSYLTRVANFSVLEVDYDDFQPQSIEINGKRSFAYRHKSVIKSQNNL